MYRQVFFIHTAVFNRDEHFVLLISNCIYSNYVICQLSKIWQISQKSNRYFQIVSFVFVLTLATFGLLNIKQAITSTNKNRFYVYIINQKEIKITKIRFINFESEQKRNTFHTDCRLRSNLCSVNDFQMGEYYANHRRLQFEHACIHAYGNKLHAYYAR